MSSEIESVLAAAIRGEGIAWDRLSPGEDLALYDEADAHGVLPLFAESVLRATDAPATLRRKVAGYRSQHAGADVMREEELRGILDAFSATSVHPMLLKGAHLAYGHYSRPDLRPRVDTDVLVPPNQLQQIDAVLTSRGYAKAPQVTGSLVMYQTAYLKFRNGALAHTVDLHWKIANPQRFADLFTFEELIAESVAIPALGKNARGPSDVHALVIACVHRVVHHFDSNRLIWLLDIHLLASRLQPAQWRSFVDIAEARGITTMCLQGLTKAAMFFGTQLPALVSTMAAANGSDAERASAAYMSAGRRPVESFMDDMRALRSWTDRRRLILEHLFPSATYMRKVYAPTSRAPLTLLYAQRAMRGARKWFAKS